MATVALSPRAHADLRKLRERRDEIEAALHALADEPWPANIDVTPLKGRAPWSRARTGDYRLIFRALTGNEVRDLGRRGRGFYVERIIHRRELERAIARL